MTTLGVLCCFALFVCLTLLASFFLPSHLSLKTYTCRSDLFSLAQGKVHFAMEITHAAGSQGSDGDIVVDRIHVDTILLPGSSLQTMAYIGASGYATAQLSFTLECTGDSKGAFCNCTDLDSDASGHYVCNSDGSISCLDGYRNATNNCLDCVPAEGCCKLVKGLGQCWGCLHTCMS